MQTETITCKATMQKLKPFSSVLIS